MSEWSQHITEGSAHTSTEGGITRHWDDEGPISAHPEGPFVFPQSGEPCRFCSSKPSAVEDTRD